MKFSLGFFCEIFATWQQWLQGSSLQPPGKSCVCRARAGVRIGRSNERARSVFNIGAKDVARRHVRNSTYVARSVVGFVIRSGTVELREHGTQHQQLLYGFDNFGVV